MNRMLPYLITLTILSAHPSAGMSCRTLDEQDPLVAEIVASRKYSPFPAMTWASFGGALTAFIVFRPVKGHPDYDRQSIKAVGTIAVTTWIASSSLLLLLSSCGVGHNIEGLLPQVSIEQVNKDRLRTDRRFFWLFHTLNTTPTLFYAIESRRSDRWAWFTGIALAPFVVDLAARYVFRSDDVSPWTLTMHAADDNRLQLTPMLAWRTNW